MGFEASWILVQIPALPLTYSVIVNEFLPVFQCPVKWGEKSLSSRFVTSVTKVAHVGYPSQGPTHNVTSHRWVLPRPLLEDRRCMRQHHQDIRRHSTIKGCELSLFPPPAIIYLLSRLLWHLRGRTDQKYVLRLERLSGVQGMPLQSLHVRRPLHSPVKQTVTVLGT